MKKTVSIIIVLFLFLSMCSEFIKVSAQNDFSREDAISLFRDSYDLFNILQNQYSENDDSPPNIICDENDLLFPPELNVFGSYKRILKIEIADKKYDIETLSDVIAVIEKYYVSNLVNSLMICSIDGDITIYEGPNGKVYFHEDDWMPWPCFVEIGFGNFKFKGESATLEIYSTRVSMSLVRYFCKANIEFKKTENGWRVSGGPMFDLLTQKEDHMKYCYKYSYVDDDDTRKEVILNPNTSDPTFHAIPALTVAALASLAIPLYVVRRRRREM